MTATIFHRIYRPLRRGLPGRLSNGLRSVATAFLTPVYFSIQSGHFLSSLRRAAVTRKMKALPWYTYPCIDFVRFQDFADCAILEFGGGQSTVFWAERARTVTTFEGDEQWFDRLKRKIPQNVSLTLVSMETPDRTAAEIRTALGPPADRKFDVVVIDGLFRPEMIPIAVDHLSGRGMIICDDSEGYGIYEGLAGSGFMRVDFHGHQPGVLLPHCTSIYFRPGCQFTNNTSRIHTVHEEDG